MFANIGLRAVLKVQASVLRESSAALCCAASVKPWTNRSSLLSGPNVRSGKCEEDKTFLWVNISQNMCFCEQFVISLGLLGK